MRLRAKKLSEETPEPTYEKTVPYSATPVKITTAQLIHRKAYLGRTEKEKNSRMSLYMLGKRNGAFIYDLDKTIVLLRKALFFLERVAAAGGKILFLGLEKNIKNMYMQVLPKWTPGILTNMEQFSRRKTKGPHTVEKVPDVVVIFGFDKPSRLALSECRKLRIPTVAVIDCHVDPTYFMYPVPGNTSTKDSLQFYFELFREAVYKGAVRRGDSSPESFLERSMSDESPEASNAKDRHDSPGAPKTPFENLMWDSKVNPSTIQDIYKMEKGPLDLSPAHEKPDPFQHVSKIVQEVFKDMKPEEVDSMVNYLNKASQDRKELLITPFEVKELRALGYKEPRSVFPFLKTAQSKY
jgi:small subunit ribosomal protein S2